MAVTRKQKVEQVVPAHASARLADYDDPDSLAAAVKITDAKPPGRHVTTVKRKRRATLGPTKFDEHMWETYLTGQYASLEVPVRHLQAVRVRLARSQRWLSRQHEDDLKAALGGVPPFTFKTSLTVTDLTGKQKLAEGPVRGTLTGKGLDTLGDDVRVILWFRMHLPLDLGRRARPEAYVNPAT